jgi:hypothetical protein
MRFLDWGWGAKKSNEIFGIAYSNNQAFAQAGKSTA